MRRLGDLVSAKKCEQGEGFVKFCVKKACVGDGGELERALDDVFGSKVTDDHVAKVVQARMAKYFQIFPPLVFSYRLFIFTNRGNFQRKTASIFKEGIGQESNGAASQEKQIFLLCQI